MGGEGRPWEHHEEGLDLSLKEPNRLPGEDDIKQRPHGWVDISSAK